jgi:uncharacterized surface protein with fasciclin (FAS1) repeats
MKFQNRFVRLGAALAIAGIIASQIPMGSSSANAADPAPPDDGYSRKGLFSFTGFGGVVAAAGLGGLVYSVITDRAGGVQAGGRVGGGVIAGLNEPIYDVTNKKPELFETISKVIRNGQQVEYYRKQGPNTVIWPTNEALGAALTPSEIQALQQAANRDRAIAFLNGFTINGRHTITDMIRYAREKYTGVTTLSGEPVAFTYDETTKVLKANGIEIIQDDYAATNGWIHAAKGLISRGDQAENPEELIPQK